MLTVLDVIRTDGNTTADHPPIPTTTLPSLPSDFDDIPKGNLQCWESYFGYSFTRNFLYTEFGKSTTRIETTFSPPRSYSSTYSYNKDTGCTTTTLGLTTLCDNIPRASARDITCRTTSAIGTASIYEYASVISTYEPTWTSEFAKPKPTCKVADDLGPICSRLFDAWKYRTSRIDAETPMPTDAALRKIQAIPPCIPLVNIPAPTARPTCRIAGVAYSAYHWSKATATGTDFCNSNWTAPTGTPTIPGTPNTVVVSGLTLTSPDVYHFLKNIKVETYRGLASQPGGMGPRPYGVWNASTTIPALTVAQPDTAILQASKTCIGPERDLCTLFFAPDFRIQDLATVRSDNFNKYCGARCLSQGGGVIYQNSYSATLAIPISEVLKQNRGVLNECDWLRYESNREGNWESFTTSSVSAVLVKNVQQTAFIPITTTEVEASRTAEPLAGPRMASVVAPTAKP